MKKVMFVCLFGLLGCLSSAQRVSRSDSLLYRAVFCDSIYFDVDYEIAQKLYKSTKYYETTLLDPLQDFLVIPPERMSYYYIHRYFDNKDSSAIYDLRYHQPSGLQSTTAFSMKSRQEVKEYVSQLYDALHVAGYDRAADRARAKRLIKDFRRQATVLPTFYGLIDSVYAGNVDAYVEDLYEKSIFTDKKRMKKFVRKPSRKKLLNDPAILYMVSKLQYEVLLQVGARTTVE